MAKYRFRIEKRSGGGEYSKRIRHLVTIDSVDYWLRMKDVYCCCDCELCFENVEELELTLGGHADYTAGPHDYDSFTNNSESGTFAILNGTYILDRDTPTSTTFTVALGVIDDYADAGELILTADITVEVAPPGDENNIQYEWELYCYAIECAISCTIQADGTVRMVIDSVSYLTQGFLRSRMHDGSEWGAWDAWTPSPWFFTPLITNEVIYTVTAPIDDPPDHPLILSQSCDDVFGGDCFDGTLCANTVTIYDPVLNTYTEQTPQELTFRARLRDTT
jgi:hypothetical protein